MNRDTHKLYNRFAILYNACPQRSRLRGGRARLPLQARPPAKPTRQSPEAKPMADGQGEAAWGTSGQAYTDNKVKPT